MDSYGKGNENSTQTDKRVILFSAKFSIVTQFSVGFVLYKMVWQPSKLVQTRKKNKFSMSFSLVNINVALNPRWPVLHSRRIYTYESREWRLLRLEMSGFFYFDNTTPGPITTACNNNGSRELAIVIFVFFSSQSPVDWFFFNDGEGRWKSK